MARRKLISPKLSQAQKAKIFCVKNGHSRVVDFCFGYVTCGRCSEQLGDTLGGGADLDDAVIVGHDCKRCRINAKKLSKKDLVYLPSKARREIGAMLG